MGDVSALMWSLWRTSRLEDTWWYTSHWASGTWALEMQFAWRRRRPIVDVDALASRETNLSGHIGLEWLGGKRQAEKILDLRAGLTAAQETRDVTQLLATIEHFGSGRARWLKVAAGAKAAVLTRALKQRPLADGEIALELGGFVGFSAARLACTIDAELQTSMRSPWVVSVEKDSGCALFATSVLEQGGVASLAEVWNGRASDLLPRILEEFGAGSVGFAFFDHSGSVYHEDLASLEDLGLLAPNAVIVADNVLKPGAPLFLWHIHSGAYDVTLLSVPEFVQTSIEDWLAICTWLGAHRACRSDPLPGGMLKLAWQGDKMRRRSERSGVSVAEWSEFARQMRRELNSRGIEAIPWHSYFERG